MAYGDKPWERPQEDAKGFTLLASYGALLTLGGIVGGIAVPWIYYYIIKPGRISWASMTPEQREEFYRMAGQGFWLRVIIGVVVGAGVALGYAVHCEMKKRKGK